MALAFILFLIFLVLPVYLFARLILKKEDSSDETEADYHESYDYELKKTIMSHSEHALYINLQKVSQGRYIILCKVRIEDFVDVIRGANKSEQEIFGLRYRIKSRHVDFLICDFQTTEPLLAIELDGSSHRLPKQRERDKFIDELYQSIGLPVEHVRVGDDFYELAKEVDLKISKKTVSTIV